MDEHLMLALLLLVTFIWLAIVAAFYLFRMHCPWYLIVPVSALIGMVIYITTKLVLSAVFIVTL